uniref:Ig-like domain-containing protein n=1 Tax=Pelusios castaneus TaxID=367368 RepID=A0A8C8S8L4_9SAUR
MAASRDWVVKSRPVCTAPSAMGPPRVQPPTYPPLLAALPVKVPATTEAVLGEVAQLNCTYPPGEGVILYWSRLGPGSEKNVFTYSRGKGLTQHNDPAYQGRATVPDGQPEHGNGALWLHNLTLADEGKYRCRVKSDTGMGRIGPGTLSAWGCSLTFLAIAIAESVLCELSYFFVETVILFIQHPLARSSPV